MEDHPQCLTDFDKMNLKDIETKRDKERQKFDAINSEIA